MFIFEVYTEEKKKILDDIGLLIHVLWWPETRISSNLLTKNRTFLTWEFLYNLYNMCFLSVLHYRSSKRDTLFLFYFVNRNTQWLKLFTHEMYVGWLGGREASRVRKMRRGSGAEVADFLKMLWQEKVVTQPSSLPVSVIFVTFERLWRWSAPGQVVRNCLLGWIFSQTIQFTTEHQIPQVRFLEL